MALTYQDEQVIEKIVGVSLEPLEKKLDKALNLLDKFAGNVKTMQEELTVIRGYKDQLEEHDERLAIIETELHISPVN